MDNGDCVQLCFAEELTNCSYEKLFNGKCDKGCDNNYCSRYTLNSNFYAPITLERWDGLYQSDDFQCKQKNVTSSKLDEFDYNINETCADSSIYSPYIDPNIPQFRKNSNGTLIQQWGECNPKVCLYLFYIILI